MMSSLNWIVFRGKVVFQVKNSMFVLAKSGIASLPAFSYQQSKNNLVDHIRIYATSSSSPCSWKLLYLQSEFRGQLPRPFDPPPNGTWTIPKHMNDLNMEEPSRYVCKSYFWMLNLLSVRIFTILLTLRHDINISISRQIWMIVTS